MDRRPLYLVGTAEPTEAALLHIGHKRHVKPFFGSTWGGAADCSATAWLRREAGGFRIKVEVVDDVLIGDAKFPWDGDTVEFYFDLRPAATRGSWSNGWLQLVAVPAIGKLNANTLHWFPEKVAKPIDGAAITSSVTAKGYEVEVFLPLEGLKAAYGLEDEFLFDCAIDDCDKAGSIKQQLRWAGSDASHLAPNSWGLMRAMGK